MWRDRRDPATLEDGKIAKALRNAFIEDYCRAVWIEIPDHMNIPNIEQGGLAIAPSHAVAWNRLSVQCCAEAIDLVDQTLARLGWCEFQIAALSTRGSDFWPGQRLRGISGHSGTKVCVQH